MQDIPSWFWMIITAGLSGMLGLILFYVAMLTKELTYTVREFRFMTAEMHDIIETAKTVTKKATKIVDTVQDTVETVSDSVVTPVKMFSAMVTRIQSVISSFVGLNEVGEVSDID